MAQETSVSREELLELVPKAIGTSSNGKEVCRQFRRMHDLDNVYTQILMSLLHTHGTSRDAYINMAMPVLEEAIRVALGLFFQVQVIMKKL